MILQTRKTFLFVKRTPNRSRSGKTKKDPKSFHVLTCKHLTQRCPPTFSHASACQLDTHSKLQFSSQKTEPIIVAQKQNPPQHSVSHKQRKKVSQNTQYSASAKPAFLFLLGNGMHANTRLEGNLSFLTAG